MLDLLVETFRINQREQRTVRATSRHPCISLVDFPVFTTNYSLTVGELFSTPTDNSAKGTDMFEMQSLKWVGISTN